MEPGIGKDIAILLVGSAFGLAPWLLDKTGITVPRTVITFGGWVLIFSFAWGMAKLASLVEPAGFRRFTVSGSAIVFLCLAVSLATWWGFRDKSHGSSIESPPIEPIDIKSPPRRPQPQLLITGANVFTPDAKDVRHRLTGIALNAKVWNVGTPTVAVQWTLFVIPQGHIPIQAQMTRIPETLRLGGNVNSAVIHATESLEQKTARDEIPSTPIEGILLFYAELPKASVIDAHTRWELSVTDIYGAQTTVVKVVGDMLSR